MPTLTAQQQQSLDQGAALQQQVNENNARVAAVAGSPGYQNAMAMNRANLGSAQDAYDAQVAFLRAQENAKVQETQEAGQKSSDFQRAALGKIGGFEGSYGLASLDSIANRTQKNINAIRNATDQAISLAKGQLADRLQELSLKGFEIMNQLSEQSLAHAQTMLENERAQKQMDIQQKQFDITNKRLSAQDQLQAKEWGVIGQEVDPLTLELKNIYGWTDKNNPGATYSRLNALNTSPSAVTTPSGIPLNERNNNPANLTYGSATKHWVDEGLAVVAPTEDGRKFLKFLDPSTGVRATVELLRSPVYANLPFDSAMRKWSGGGYGAEIAPEFARITTGSMDGAQMQTLVNRMSQAEGTPLSRWGGTTIAQTNTTTGAQTTGIPLVDAVIENPALLDRYPASTQAKVVAIMNQKGIQLPSAQNKNDVEWLANQVINRKIDIKGNTLSREQKDAVSKYLSDNGIPLPRPLTVKEQNAVADAESGYTATIEAEQLWKQDPNLLLKNYLPGILGRAAGASTFRTYIQEMTDVKTRIRTGAALNNQEIAFYKNQAPILGDSKQDVQNKFNIMKSFYLGMRGEAVTLKSPDGKLVQFNDLFDLKQREGVKKLIQNENYTVVD